jgi:3-isopropylmalate/(R)-2-methylmalate dehydratase small subunit
VSIEGRVWKFGDGVNTDVIAPGKHLFLPLAELSQYTLAVLDPAFPKECRPGDLIVAGRNFGCGSSREQAPLVLKHLGVSCVLAESFARIFYRNCIAVGLPVMAVPGLSQEVGAGEVLAVELTTGEVIKRSSGAVHHGRALPPKMLEVLQQGGILPALKRLAESESR